MNDIKNYLNKIDYTILDLNATEEELKSVCEKAKELKVKSVCVYPQHAKIVSECLRNSEVLTCCVYNFPNGDFSDVKITDPTNIINNNVDEIDIVIDYKYIKEHWKDIQLVDEHITKEILLFRKTIHNLYKAFNNKDYNYKLKVIIESGELNKAQIEYLTKLCINLDVDYIKTSTGKTTTGAKLSDIKTIKNIIDECHSPLKIKASGGIKTLKQLNDFSPYVERYGMSYKTVDNLLKK